MTWLLARLSEGSTWRGAIWLLTALGVSLSPEAWQYITTIGMAAAGLIGVLTKDKPSALPPIELQARPDPYEQYRAERLRDVPPDHRDESGPGWNG